jgi:hypothetical protein
LVVDDDLVLQNSVKEALVGRRIRQRPLILLCHKLLNIEAIQS